MANFEQWAGFEGRNWKSSVDVRDFIQENYTPYEGDESFLEGPTEAQTSYGANYRNFRKKKELKAEFLTWRQKLFPVLRLMVLDI